MHSCVQLILLRNERYHQNLVWTVKKELAVSRVLSWTTIHLGKASPPCSSDLPRDSVGHTLMPLYLVLLQVGFTMPLNVATSAVRSYRTLSPLPASRSSLRRSALCCTFRRLAPPRSYLAPYPMEPGLSSTGRQHK